jgi:hypothetical protein
MLPAAHSLSGAVTSGNKVIAKQRLRVSLYIVIMSLQVNAGQLFHIFI